MKKCIYIVMALVLSFALTSCAEKSSMEKSEETATPIASETPEPSLKPEPTEIDLNDIKKYLKENYEKVRIDGSTSMIPLHTALNKEFGQGEQALHSKTVEAFEKFMDGENHILLGVDYNDELLEKAESKGVNLAKKEITKEAFVFLINSSNPVKDLTIDQIKAIYSGKITNWSEVGGDDAKIEAFQRNPDSGSQIRMNKFMGEEKLLKNNVIYYQGMGDIVEAIADFDSGKYSIAYNMYTFIEKQYTNEEVILLSVNGVRPDDEAIFNEEYPIIIYNYVYYDENNSFVEEFAKNLYIYLMSDEGQKLISEAGYVNLNTNYGRNKNVEKPYDSYDYGLDFLEFYNEAKNEYYSADEQGNLLVFDNFVDYVLRDTEHMDNEKIREIISLIENSSIPKNQNLVFISQEFGLIRFDPWWDASLDPEDFFNYKYQGKYYYLLVYDIEKDKFILSACEKITFDDYINQDWAKGFSEYAEGYEPDSTIELTKEDLKDLYFRQRNFSVILNGVEVKNYDVEKDDIKIKLDYYKAFE